MDRKMNILYISHYYPPEVNAPAMRVSELSRCWAKQGHNVTVLTGFPNHPCGVIPEEYQGLLRDQEVVDNINVIRTYIYAAPNKGFIKRILNYLSFMFSAIVLGTGRVGRPDVLIATSPQLFVGVAGYVISRIKKCKFVFEVRDLWPEEIVAVGAVKNRFVINMLEKLEMFLYRKADLIVAVAEGTIDTLVKRGIPEEKLALISNGVDIERFQFDHNQDHVKRVLGFENKFVVSYIGTHGMAHRLETVLDAADRLKADSRIIFLLIGDGAEKENLIRQAREKKLSNVCFYDQLDRQTIPTFYQTADLFLVPLRKADLFKRNIPSKIYEIMAAKKPMIIATEGESRKLVEKHGAGISISPENSEEMAESIKYLQDNGEVRRRMGENGYAYVLANASRKQLAEDYSEVFQAVLDGKRLSTKLRFKRKAEQAVETLAMSNRVSEPLEKSRIRELAH